MNKFDQKFGTEFIRTLPCLPGVYRVHDAEGTLIYIGKAKNLRRRLSQYRNAKRRKKHLKMRTIVRDAERIEYEVCEDELQALLLETRLIQIHRPKWNIAGAFWFLYPLVGFKTDGSNAFFCFTTEPDRYPEFRFHGSYRSRHLTGNAFFSLMKLMHYVGHRIPARQIVKIGLAGERLTEKDRKTRSWIFGFRQIDCAWLERLETFFRGKSTDALEELVLKLLDHSTALRNREQVQDWLNDLKRFWRHEARRLAGALIKSDFQGYPVPQKERDFVFLRSRNAS